MTRDDARIADAQHDEKVRRGQSIPTLAELVQAIRGEVSADV